MRCPNIRVRGNKRLAKVSSLASGKQFINMQRVTLLFQELNGEILTFQHISHIEGKVVNNMEPGFTSGQPTLGGQFELFNDF